MSDQQRHESPEIGSMICRMMNALIRRAADGDQEALEALALVERTAPGAMSAGLAVARDAYSLAELADVVGVTRSAVAQRTKREHFDGTSGCGHARCVGVKRCREAS